MLSRIHIFCNTGNFEERWKIGFYTAIFCKASWDLQLSGAPPVVESTSSCREHPPVVRAQYLQLSKAPTVVRSIERTYSCLDHLQLSRASSVVESTFSYLKYPQLSRAPPLVQSISSCREHLQLSEVSLAVESTSSCPKYLQLSRAPPVVQSASSCPKYLQLSRASPVVESTPSCREHLHLSKVPPVVESDFCQTGSVIPLEVSWIIQATNICSTCLVFRV